MPRDEEAWKHTKERSSKHLNNLTEQDHRGAISRTGPMLGFNNLDCAATTMIRMEMLHPIRKEQFALGSLRLKNQAGSAIRDAALSA